MWKSPIGRVRAVGMVEGISFVALLGIAMPLKYVHDMPMAVTIVGMAHGVLFLIFGAVLLQTKIQVGWSLRRAGAVFVAAVLPLGPFVIDHSLKREEESRAS